MKMRIGTWTPRVGGVRRRVLRLGDHQATQFDNGNQSWVERHYAVGLPGGRYRAHVDKSEPFDRLYKGLAWFRELVESGGKS